MSSPNKQTIAIIGGGQATQSLLDEAQEAGRLIAASGAALVTGGLGGIMEAASKGANKAGGNVIGILPGEDTSKANPYVTTPIATGMGIGRNIVIVRTADALIAIGGQYGTLSEIAYALQMGKPVIAIGSWDIDGVQTAATASEAVRMALESIKKDNQR